MSDRIYLRVFKNPRKPLDWSFISGHIALLELSVDKTPASTLVELVPGKVWQSITSDGWLFWYIHKDYLDG